MTPWSDGVSARIASSEADLAAVTETISLAFHEDPTWSWAFPDVARRQQHYAVLWGFMISSAMRYSSVFLTEGCTAASVWIPPGGTEITAEDEAQLERLLDDLLRERAGEVLELFERFSAAHPHDEPHYHLTFLGTHPSHAGRGLGMALLAENLQRIDSEHMPAYLESSNPGNNHRYERHGFVERGAFYPPSSDIPVTTMWRDAR